MKKNIQISKHPQIMGIIIPAKWDDKGDITGVTIQTNDERVYLVEHNRTGDELLNFIRKKVEVRGRVRERLDGNTLISVQSYEIIAEEVING